MAATILKTNVVLSQNSLTFNLSDATENYGRETGQYLRENISAARLLISHVDPITGSVTDLPEYLFTNEYSRSTDNPKKTYLEQWKANGYVIIDSSLFGYINGFPDGYYEITLYCTVDGTVYNYRNDQGFMPYLRMRSRRLPMMIIGKINIDTRLSQDIISLRTYTDLAEMYASIGAKAYFSNLYKQINKKINSYGISFPT